MTNRPRRKRARNRITQKNVVLTTLSNFFLALSIGAVGSAFAPVFSIKTKLRYRSILAFCYGIAFVLVACYIGTHKEKNR